MYTYTSCEPGDIYTNAYIYLRACVRVCIRNMYICIPARCPQNPASEGKFLLAVAFREISHRWRTFRSSDPKR